MLRLSRMNFVNDARLHQSYTSRPEHYCHAHKYPIKMVLSHAMFTRISMVENAHLRIFRLRTACKRTHDEGRHGDFSLDGIDS